MGGKNMSLANESNNRRKGYIVSGVIHALLLLLFLMPFVTQPVLLEQGGILIAFGEPDAGVDSESIAETTPTRAESTETSESSPQKAQTDAFKASAEEAPVKAKAEPQKKPASPAKSPVVNTAAQKAEEERKKKAAEDKARAEQEAAEKAKMENQKKKYSDLLSKGKGNGGATGNQGSPEGDPDKGELDKVSRGSGRVGGGLSGRGVLYEPTFSDNSQKTGKVTLNICVDKEGKVTNADFTQKGSTTSDSYLIDLARKSAMKYRFSRSETESQCGTVTVEFKLK